MIWLGYFLGLMSLIKLSMFQETIDFYSTLFRLLLRNYCNFSWLIHPSFWTSQNSKNTRHELIKQSLISNQLTLNILLYRKILEPFYNQHKFININVPLPIHIEKSEQLEEKFLVVGYPNVHKHLLKLNLIYLS